MSRSRRRKHNKYIPKNNVNRKPPVMSLKLSKELTEDKSPVTEKDVNGNITYAMQYIGDEKFEYWMQYEDKKPINYKDSRGRSWNCMYNRKGNISNYWDYSGYEETYAYYKNNLCIMTDCYGNSIKKRINRDKVSITRDIFIMSNNYI